MHEKQTQYKSQLIAKLNELLDKYTLTENSVLGIVDPNFKYKDYIAEDGGSKILKYCENKTNVDSNSPKLTTAQKNKLSSCLKTTYTDLQKKISTLQKQTIPNDAIFGILDPQLTYKEYKENKTFWYLEKLCLMDKPAFKVNDLDTQAVIGEIDFTKNGSRYPSLLEIPSTTAVDFIFNTDFTNQPGCRTKVAKATIGVNIVDAKGQLIGLTAIPAFKCD
jgi:hypothetical protein